MLSFDSPRWFALFLGFPLLLWVRFFWRGRGGRVLFPFQIWGGDGFYPPGHWWKILFVLTSIFYWLGASSLIIALAGPGLTRSDQIHLSRGMDIMIVLDQSPSMGAQDFHPDNRFEAAREMIRRFIRDRAGDSIGLVTFASDAALRSPPTADHRWLINRLDELTLRELGDDTAIGMGLAVAVLHLTHSTAPDRVILLLTDGDNNAGEIRPETAARLSADQGIRIYTVGIGGEGEVAIELTDRETGHITRGLIATRFDEEELRSLADFTGGGYWRASGSGALEAVLQTVNALESVERRVSVRVITRAMHQPFIFIGILLIFLAYGIRVFAMGERS